jgi:hypothetical protein
VLLLSCIVDNIHTECIVNLPTGSKVEEFCCKNEKALTTFYGMQIRHILAI